MGTDDAPGGTDDAGADGAAGTRAATDTEGHAPVVTVVNVSFSYDDDEPVLHEVSFTAPAGATTVIMGPSGVGKTTLLKVILGLREPDHGEVSIGGRSVTEAEPAELGDIRGDVGVLLGGSTVHDGSVFASMSAWDNVRYPLKARGHDPSTIDDRAWQRMIEFDLTEHPHHLPHELSGGTRRRLALARAFVDDPHLLVLDDPGTALDLTNRESITESIRTARARTDATVLMTSHDIDMAKALGDHLVVLLSGRVVASGPASELLDGVYETEDFDARFAFRAAFDADTGNSLALARADQDFRTLFERLNFAAIVGMALVSLAGMILIIILTAYYVY